MSEPKARADRIDDVVAGVRTWSLHDERINFVGTSYAVDAGGGAVVIDPHPLTDEAAGRLGEVTAICLTTSSHQRASWRLRRELGVPVYAPALSKEVEEEPDHRYADGDVLPGGLRAIFTPGAGTTQHSFLLERDGGVIFVPDLFVRPPSRELTLIPEQYAHDLPEACRSAEKLLELPFEVLCLGHGAPVADDPKRAIRRALAERAKRPTDASDWETSE